jgi:hypothetical protein
MVNLLEIGELLPNGTYRLFDGAREYRRIRQTAAQKNFLANNGLQFVNSSVISAVGVDGNDLIIRFHNGSMYSYKGAGGLFDKQVGADSRGRYFNRNIKGKFPFKKLPSLLFPKNIQTIETAEMELLSDEQIFKTLETQEFKRLISNLENPTIKFNIAFDDAGNELLQILINGVAIYYLMDTVLKEAKKPREIYFEQLGIAI